MQATDLVVLNYSTGDIDFYEFDLELDSEQVQDFLFNKKKYKDSEISYMVGTKLNFNNYGRSSDLL